MVYIIMHHIVKMDTMYFSFPTPSQNKIPKVRDLRDNQASVFFFLKRG